MSDDNRVSDITGQQVEWTYVTF